MADSTRKPGDPGEPSKIGTVRSSGRRRWLQAGISAAPVVMTVASRPVLAAIECRTVSGHVSGDASGNPGDGFCGGGKPTYWLANTTQPPWPIALNTTFNSIFEPDLTPGDPTFLQVLQADSGSLASYIVAAYLNNAEGSVPGEEVLPQSTIVAMWAQAYPGGPGFGLNIPGAGLWFAADVIVYLQSTMIDR